MKSKKKYCSQMFLKILILSFISVLFAKGAACQFSIGDLHRFPSLRDNKEENKWFRDWIAAFPGININYPAIRIGTQRVDVRDIPHEWDIVNPDKGWPDYTRMIWGEEESYITPWITGLLDYYSIFFTFKAEREPTDLIGSGDNSWRFPSFDYMYNFPKYELAY